MADMAQIDRIISEINTLKEKERIILFHKIEEIQDNEEITLESAFGLWKDRKITKESLREMAWRKN
jgi:SET domain-containing protein